MPPSLSRPSSPTLSETSGELPPLYELFSAAVESLIHVSPSETLLMKHVRFIRDSMNLSSRYYHSLGHVFDVSRNLKQDPLAVLAVLFHDCIYAVVDGGLTSFQEERLQGILTPKMNQLAASPPSVVDGIVQAVFGFQGNQEITQGLNEFLSAIVAVRALHECGLPLKDLAAVAACIEATVPFRSKPMDRLYENLHRATVEYQLGMDENEIVVSVQRAVRVAHEDLANFGTSDFFYFLDNTWSLLPENNKCLRSDSFSILELQRAVGQVHGFFNFLQAENIFPSFRGVPSEQVMQERVQNAQRNLVIGRKYTAVKFLTLSVIAAFGVLSDRGDIPLVEILGSPNCESDEGVKLPVAVNDKVISDPDVTRIVLEGRRSKTSFDFRKCVAVAQVYSMLGDEGISQILKDIKLCPLTREAAKQLLQVMPRDFVISLSEHFASACDAFGAKKVRAVVETL